VAKTVTVDEAKAGLSDLIEAAVSGEEVLIAKDGRARVRLVPVEAPPARPRVPGLFKGRIWMSDDFDDPLPDDLLRLFYEGEESDPLREPAPR
jgi:prevent-host-death family protein